MPNVRLVDKVRCAALMISWLVRCGQHNRLRGTMAASIKKEKIEARFRGAQLSGLSGVEIPLTADFLTRRMPKPE